jgi:hypothetical protein
VPDFESFFLNKMKENYFAFLYITFCIVRNNLIKQKLKFIPLIKSSSLEAEELAVVHQNDKWVAMSFIEKGRPSEWYLETILQLLKDNGVDTSSITEVTTESHKSINEEFGVRASDVPQGHEWRHIFPNKF